MATIEVIRPYVEQKIAEVLGAEQVSADQDGDIPIRRGSAICFARLLEGPTGPMLRIFAPMLVGVRKKAKLFEALNGINANAPYVRFFWAEDQVYCVVDLVAETLQSQEIANALGAVSWHADNLDDLLQKDFGGARAFEEGDPGPKPRSDPAYL